MPVRHRQGQEQEYDKIKDKNKSTVQVQEETQDKSKTKYKTRRKQDIEQEKTRQDRAFDSLILAFCVCTMVLLSLSYSVRAHGLQVFGAGYHRRGNFRC